MNDDQTKLRWFQFSLRRLFILFTIVTVVTAWAGLNWRLERKRRELLRVPQAFYFDKYRTSIKWHLFGTRQVYFIHLMPGTFDDAYLADLRECFPEAEICISADPDEPPRRRTNPQNAN